jgi:hypothetical protein
MGRLGVIALLSALTVACVPEDELDGGPDSGGSDDAGVSDMGGEAPSLGALGDECQCPASECEDDAESCVCEGENGSGPCADGLVCLGDASSGECTQACEEGDPDACPSGFVCSSLQLGNSVTGPWCLSSGE